MHVKNGCMNLYILLISFREAVVTPATLLSSCTAPCVGGGNYYTIKELEHHHHSIQASSYSLFNLITNSLGAIFAHSHTFNWPYPSTLSNTCKLVFVLEFQIQFCVCRNRTEGNLCVMYRILWKSVGLLLIKMQPTEHVQTFSSDK